jgi:tyrosine-protein kinase Etk/Wzc
MSEEIRLNQFVKNKSLENEEAANLRKIFSLIISKKYVFFGAFIIAFACAYCYNIFTIPVYKVSATLLIEEDKKSNASGNDQLLEGFGLMPGMKNLDNQIMVLSSRSLVRKTLEVLPFELEFYYQGLIKKRSLYPAQPVNMIFDSLSKLPEDVKFSIKYLGNDMFSLDAKSDKAFEIHRKASFGDNIDFNGGSFRIELKEYGWIRNKSERKLHFIYHSRRKLVEDYIKRLKIEPASKKGTMVKISLEGTNKIEDLDFLRKLTDIFLNISLEKKNIEAIRTIQFIDDQLIGISDSLLLTESKLQKFRANNRVMNLSAQGQVIIDQANNLENEKARLGMEDKYYNYLSEYLEKDIAGEVPIAPATMGIVDPGLTKLVADLADLQGKLYSKTLGDKNPLQSQLTQQIQNIKQALKETLKGMKGGNSLAMKENQNQIDAINARAYALPKTERELLGIERKYKLNDGLYTFLLEKRSVAQMQKASNIADNEMIDYPEYDNEPVSPNKPMVYLLAILTGIGFPFLWIFLADIFNIKIRKLEEINQLTEIPITGYIPHSPNKKRTVVLDEPDSPVAEAFRLLRSRMTFFIKDIKSPVILITSSIPDEGKTFTAVNLASTYSLMGKKTILVGFDLRQPMIYTDFNLNNENGVSTWLIGKDELQDIIKTTNHNNLDVISSGPIPPNPSELTLLEKTDELFRMLKESYDCIIVDSSPAGIVSDTYHLASLADTCILVVRQNYTIKDLFVNTIKDLKISNIKSLSLLINDLVSDNRRYGYGRKYTYNNNKPKKKITKK